MENIHCLTASAITTQESWSTVALIIKFMGFHSTFMLLVKEQAPALLQVCSEVALEEEQACVKATSWAEPARSQLHVLRYGGGLSTSLCPAASQPSASGRMTQQGKERLSPDLTGGLHLSSFPLSVRTGSFPI